MAQLALKPSQAAILFCSFNTQSNDLSFICLFSNFSFSASLALDSFLAWASMLAYMLAFMLVLLLVVPISETS